MVNELEPVAKFGWKLSSLAPGDRRSTWVLNGERQS